MRRIQLLTFCITIALAAGAQTVTIEQLRPGELGRQVLRQVENLKDVVQLTIQGGTMNYQDMELLQETMPNLEALDLGGIDNTTLTAVDQSDGSNYRRSFTLGEKPRLKRLVLPSRLTILEKLGQVPSIEELDVPPSVVRIQQGVIQNGYLDGEYLSPQLRRLTLHEGLQVIDPGAFDGCDSLRQVTLPSTVIKATRAFTGCDNLKEVTSLAPVPPLLANVNRRQQWNWEKQVNEVIVTYEDYEGLFGYSRSYNLSDYMKDYVLTCPSTGGYELERGWDHFPYVKDLEGDPAKDYRVAYHYGIIGNDVPTNKPNLTLACGYIEDKNNNYNNIAFAGKMTTRSEQTLSIGTYTHETNQDETVLDDRNSSSWQGLTNMDDAWASLYCNGPMRADTVKIAMRFTRFDTSRTYWAFAALPFDTKVGDLKITEGSGVQWAIRKYSGLKRANAQFDEVWVKQTADSVLHAGEGFIVAAEWNHDQSDGATLVFTAQNNANKNRLFTSQDVEMPLQQYAAQSDCDRSWNLVGNPYPCFYSTKYFQPSAPFTVYDKARRYYRTYSPIDDDYVLRPFEAFFIQRPVGYDRLTLPQYGRFESMADYEEFMKELSAQSRGARRLPPQVQNPERKVINLLLSKDTLLQDRTRLVVNPDAQRCYEAGWDATKFRELQHAHTLLYIIGADETHYAISEQPIDKGEEVRLGAYFAEAGTYTISGEAGWILLDAQTGVMQQMSQPYTFTAEAGPADHRFRMMRASGFQNGDITVDGVDYRVDYTGRAYVQAVNTQQERVEIPAFITYEGEKYRVSEFTTNALQNNTAVRHLILPSTITRSGGYINGEDPLESITLYALVPPESAFTIDSYNTEKRANFRLYVPKVAVDTYKTTKDWWNLPNILPAPTEADIIAMEQGTVTFDDTTKPSNQPQLLLYDDQWKNHGGHVGVEGTKPLHLSYFNMNITSSDYWEQQHLRDTTDVFCSSFINTCSVTADGADITMTGDDGLHNNWNYLCLPFPLKVSDISGTLPFVTSVRRYDGQGRADGHEQSGTWGSRYGNWKEVAATDIIPAGEGFVLNYYSATPQSGSSDWDFQMKLPVQGATDALFATTRTITLKDYPSEKAEDRGWNLVGNTFPAYYRMADSDLGMPYMVWGTDDKEYKMVAGNVKHYYTYTRDDDDMLLRPFQAFFVQYSPSQPTINMPASGRYHSYPDFLQRQQPLSRVAQADGRRLYDLNITGDGQHDRTRIVLNDRASAAYEPTCDAPKVLTDGMAMLYTEEDGLKLSINERPAPAKSLTLCIDVATEGDYTLSLGKHTGTGITVTDLETGTATLLDDGSYTFHAQEGTRRFAVGFDNTSGIAEIVNRKWSDGPYFDLQGRKVERQPQPGIYLRNGKKIIVK